MSDEHKHLTLKDGSRLGWLEKNYKLFLNKMTLIFGASESGKSTIIDEIMVLIKPYIPLGFVICPTNKTNQAYTGKVPRRCIKDGKNLKKLARWLEMLLERQEDACEMYMIANNVDNLKALFSRCNDSHASKLAQLVCKGARDSMIFVDNAKDLNFAQKKAQKTSIMKDRDRTIRKIYKTTIRFNKLKLESADLSDLERAALTFLDLNPQIYLIFDDCASTFKQLYKLTPAIKKIFYEGRHKFISTILCSQDDKEIDSELRKNSMTSIFTTSRISTSTFDRTSNGYPKHDRVRAKLAIEKVFKQEPNKPKHYQKLVYLQNQPDPFRYTIADLYPDFKMGCDAIWDFDNKLHDGNATEVTDNPFFAKYKK